MVFGLFKKKSKPKIYQFDSHPNGKYVVKYIEETYSHDEFILVVLEITRGEYSGDKIPVMFQNQKAKKISREYTGMFLDRLAYEGVAKASKLDDAMRYAESDSNNEFIVNLKDSAVSSVPEYDFEAVEKMILKLKPR
jgi:hypothetical protein